MLYAAACFMLIFGLVYFFWKESGSKKPLVFKALATFMPVLLALCYARNTGSFSAWCVFAGLFCYMAADVLLEIWFLTGVAFFGAGHICVMIGVVQRNGVSWYVLAAFAVLYGGMFLAIRRYMGELRGLLVPGLIYAALLCLMAALTVAAGITSYSLSTILMGAGGVCFVVSDTILGWSHLSGKRRRQNSAILLALYYMAVYLLSASQYF